MSEILLLKEVVHLQVKAQVPLQLYKTTGESEYLNIYHSLMKQAEILFKWYRGGNDDEAD